MRDAPFSGNIGCIATIRSEATNLTMIYLVAWNGAPSFSRVGPFATFNPDGIRTLGGPCPPGLGGNVAAFKAFGIIYPGKVGASNEEVVTFL